jgi:SpoVK/Ycf46/Vps4 family AAA+-type ATPase
VLSLDVAHPTAGEQRQLWLALVGPDPTVDAIVGQFDLDIATIGAVAASPEAERDGLWSACRAHTRPRFGGLVDRIESTATWDDLVVPHPQRELLGHIAAHARHRYTVFDRWGLRAGGDRTRGQGTAVLFCGASGTGKTLAAEILAGELSLDLYRIDLASVVSKYIGETEKNLREVFDASADGGSILLFDEADALFGKRSEVKDSHDRYANTEIAYLLQRMEQHPGIAILTTNMREAIDAAFVRRLRFVVEFPFPDAAQRIELWRRAFPPPTPTAALDIERLSRLDLSGGSIRNVSVLAAFLAADDGGKVEMSHVFHAARIELAKLERPVNVMREVS